MKKILLLAFIFAFIAGSYAQERNAGPAKKLMDNKSITSISVIDMDGSTTTAADLAESILGPGITYSNISFTGLASSPASAGLFSGGVLAGLTFESGIILSSGYVSNAVGPNSSSAITANLYLTGDSDLDGLIPGYSTYDATILEFDFSLPADSIYIEFSFGSDEYNEWVGSAYNDVFAFFLDGTNIALITGTTTPVSINNVNNGSYASYYIDNESAPFVADLECDGFTTTLSGTFPLNSNPIHHIKLAIADAGDHILDSWVFIRESSFSIPIEVDLGPDIEICEGESVILDAGNPGYDFLWSTGETTQTITVDVEGEYSVQVSYLGNTESDTVYVTVYPLPIANAGDDETIYIGYPPLYTQLDATGGVLYSWSPTTGLDNPNIANPIAQPGSTTTYTVTVTDVNGCSNTDDVIVNVIDVRCGKKMDKVLVCHIPPGNPGNLHTICISANAVPAHLEYGDYLGSCIDEPSDGYNTEDPSPKASAPFVNENEWNIYPNPAYDLATIELSAMYGYEVQVTIFDVTGKVLWNHPSKILESPVIEVDLMKLPSGIYHVVLQTNNQSMARKLVIVK